MAFIALCNLSSWPWNSFHCSYCPVQVYKHKPKKHYQRKTGHRQPLTKFLITKISPAAATAEA